MKIKTIKDIQKVLSNYDIVFVNKYPFLSTPRELYKRKIKAICNTKESNSSSIKRYYNIIWSSASFNEDDIIKAIKNYKNSNSWVYIHIRKPKNLIKSFCQENNINIIANKQEIVENIENKKKIKSILNEIWIFPIPGENIIIKDFINSKYQQRNKYWKKIVIQLPDIRQWWGKGTFFIENENKFKELQKIFYKGIYRNTKIQSININKYIDWLPASIACCTTRYWTITTNLQTQIIDENALSKPNENKGVFCGHDRWSYTYHRTAQTQSQNIWEKIWDYLYTVWYRGIFWVDYIIKGKEIYFVECNARITAAFPVASLIDLNKWIIPLEAFHLLELINIDYEIDFEKINNMYKYKKKWSHIILNNVKDKEISCKKTLPVWTYKYSRSKLTYINDLLDYKPLKRNEFIIVNGNPKKWDIIKSQWRICQIITKNNVLEKKTLKLKKNITKLTEIIYKDYFNEI